MPRWYLLTSYAVVHISMKRAEIRETLFHVAVNPLDRSPEKETYRVQIHDEDRAPSWGLG